MANPPAQNRIKISTIDSPQFIGRQPFKLHRDVLLHYLHAAELPEVSNVEELERAAHEIRSALLSLDVFRDVKWEVSGPAPSDATVKLIAEEKHPWSASAGIHQRTDEESGAEASPITLSNWMPARKTVAMHVSGKWRNPTGWGDSLSISLSAFPAALANAESGLGFAVSYRTPIMFLRNPLKMYLPRMDWEVSSLPLSLPNSLSGTSSGTSIHLHTSQQSTFRYEWAWRRPSPQKYTANALKDDCEDSILSAFSYRRVYDLSKWLFGALGGFSSEITLAGPFGGDARFLRWRGDFGFSKALFGNWQLLGRLRCGVSAPLFGAASHVADRSFLMSEVRGYDFVGPRAPTAEVISDGEVPNGRSAPWEALGGNVFYSASLRAITPLPDMIYGILPLWGQIFVNAGSVANGKVPLPALLSPNDGTDRVGFVSELVRRTHTSIGAGLVLPLGQVHIEGNYCIPLRYAATTRRQRWQLGVSLSF